MADSSSFAWYPGPPPPRAQVQARPEQPRLYLGAGAGASLPAAQVPAAQVPTAQVPAAQVEARPPVEVGAPLSAVRRPLPFLQWDQRPPPPSAAQWARMRDEIAREPRTFYLEFAEATDAAPGQTLRPRPRFRLDPSEPAARGDFAPVQWATEGGGGRPGRGESRPRGHRHRRNRSHRRSRNRGRNRSRGRSRSRQARFALDPADRALHARPPTAQPPSGTGRQAGGARPPLAKSPWADSTSPSPFQPEPDRPSLPDAAVPAFVLATRSLLHDRARPTFSRSLSPPSDSPASPPGRPAPAALPPEEPLGLHAWTAAERTRALDLSDVVNARSMHRPHLPPPGPGAPFAADDDGDALQQHPLYAPIARAWGQTRPQHWLYLLERAHDAPPAILKLPRRARSDSLYYEFQLGVRVLNQWRQCFPFFLETLGLLQQAPGAAAFAQYAASAQPAASVRAAAGAAGAHPTSSPAPWAGGGAGPSTLRQSTVIWPSGGSDSGSGSAARVEDWGDDRRGAAQQPPPPPLDAAELAGRFRPVDAALGWEDACAQAETFALLSEFVPGMRSLAFHLEQRPEIVYFDLPGICLQVYFLLGTLRSRFAHNALSPRRVSLCRPAPPGQYILYHLHDKDHCCTRFPSEFLVKLVGYGRAFARSAHEDTAMWLHSVRRQCVDGGERAGFRPLHEVAEHFAPTRDLSFLYALRELAPDLLPLGAHDVVHAWEQLRDRAHRLWFPKRGAVLDHPPHAHAHAHAPTPARPPPPSPFPGGLEPPAPDSFSPSDPDYSPRAAADASVYDFRDWREGPGGDGGGEGGGGGGGGDERRPSNRDEPSLRETGAPWIHKYRGWTCFADLEVFADGRPWRFTPRAASR